MGIIARYMRWIGHDAGGTLPPLEVFAGILRPSSWRVPADWSPLRADEALVYVPAQWIGAWETGHMLAPAYQYLWRVSHAHLFPLPATPANQPYRPAELPISACSPGLTRRDWERLRAKDGV